MTICFREKIPFGDVINSQHVLITDSENELTRPKLKIAAQMTQSAEIGQPKATSTQISEAGK